MRHPHGILTLRREDGRVVCERVRVADTWFRRLRGALFRRSLPSQEGFVLRPAFSIHTMFMQFPIDVIFLDQDLTVLKISAETKPFRTAACRGAREVVELRAGECERRGLDVGDRVAWASFQKPPTNDPTGGPRPGAAPLSHGSVLVASDDERFVKLLRLLLAARSVEFVSSIDPASLPGVLAAGLEGTAVVLDVGDSVADGLSIANASRGLDPDLPIVVVGSPEVAARAPAGMRIYDKWAEPEDLVDTLLAALEGGGLR